MLRLADIRRTSAQRLEAEFRGRDADAVDVARRQADRAGEADIERVEVGAFAVEIARLDHGGNVADAAAFGRGVAEGVLDHPVVERARPGHVALLSAHDVLGGFLDQAIDRDQLGAGQAALALGVAERRHRGLGRKSRAVLRLHFSRYLDDGVLLVGGPFDAQHLGAVLGIAQALCAFHIAGPADAAGTLPVGGLESRQRDPGLAGAALRLDARGQPEGAPAFGHRVEDDALRGRHARREARDTGGHTDFENFAALHIGCSHGL